MHGGDVGGDRWARSRRQIAALWRDAAIAAARDGWVFDRGVLSRESGEGNLGVLVSRADWFGYDLPGTHIYPFVSSASVARAFGMSWPARGRAETAPDHLSLPSIELAVTDDQERAGGRSQYSPDAPVLHRDSAPAWLRESVATVVDWIDAHLTDEQLLAAYLDGTEQMGFMALRNAAVLARIVGREDLVPDLVRLSESARLRSLARSGRQDDPSSYSDRSRDPILWSHRRFVRFLDALPPEAQAGSAKAAERNPK